MKFMNKLMGAVLGGAMAMGALTLSTASHAMDPMVTLKVIFQVGDNDSAKWNLALNNAKSVRKVLKCAVVEIVAYGPGIGMLKGDSEVANRVSEAADAGVKVVAYGNTMRGAKLT